MRVLPFFVFFFACSVVSAYQTETSEKRPSSEPGHFLLPVFQLIVFAFNTLINICKLLTCISAYVVFCNVYYNSTESDGMIKRRHATINFDLNGSNDWEGFNGSEDFAFNGSDAN